MENEAILQDYKDIRSALDLVTNKLLCDTGLAREGTAIMLRVHGHLMSSEFVLSRQLVVEFDRAY